MSRFTHACAQGAEREVNIERCVYISVQDAAVLQKVGDGTVAVCREPLVRAYFLVDWDRVAIEALGPLAEPSHAHLDRAAQLPTKGDRARVDQRVGGLGAMGFEPSHRAEAIA